MAEQGTIIVYRSIGDLVFDAVFEEAHSADLEITDNPVEEGVLISDHAYMMPLQLIITAGVSDILLPSGNPDYGASGSGRPQTAYEALRDLQEAREPFDVQTGLQVYENMLIKQIRTTQNKHNPDVLTFVAYLREVLIVGTESASYPPRKGGETTQQASKTKDKGEQQGKTTDPAKDKPKTTSLAKKIWSAVK